MNPQTINGLASLSNPEGPNAAPALQSQGTFTQVASTANDAPSAAPADQMATAPQEAWWKRILPTAGGIIGGIGGAAIGGLADVASLGALAPVINPFTAGVAGASLAGSIGKAGENALTGQKVLQGNVVTSGLEQGASQALGEGVGLGLAKVAGAGAKLATGRANSLIANSEKAAADARAAQEASDAAQAAQDKALANKNNFGGVDRGIQSANNLKDNQGLLDEWGHDSTDPQVMQDKSKAGLFIDDIDNEALAQGSPINTMDLINSHDITNATPEEQQALLNSGIVTEDGRVPATVTPQQANQFAQNLGSQVRDTKATLENAKANGRGADVTSLRQQYNNLNQLYKRVQNVAGTSEVNQAIAERIVTPEEKQALVEQYGQKQADYVEQQINNAKTHQDLVAAKLPFAQMNTVSEQALKDMQATGTPRAVAREKAENPIPKDDGKSNGGFLSGPAATGLELAGIPLTHGLSAIPAAINISRAVASNPALLNGIARVADSGVVQKGVPAALAAGGNFVAGSYDPSSAPASQPVSANSATGGTMNQSPQNIFTSQSPMDQALAQQALYEMFAPSLMPDSIVNNAFTAEQQMQRANQANAILPLLEQQYNAAGGGQGLLGGGLAALQSLIPGTAAHTYNQERGQAAQQIAAATGMPASDVILPNLMQSRPTAQSAIGSVQALLNLAGGNTGINPVAAGTAPTQ